VSSELLTLGFSVLSERVGNIEPPQLNLPVKIIISIQDPDNANTPLPSSFQYESFESKNRGVTKSRNVVLDRTRTKYLLFADDENRFLSEGITTVINYLEKNPQCDLVLAQAIDEDGNLRKDYPKSQTNLNRFNCARAATYEMIVRMDAVKSAHLYFDENFGAGAENYLGDEYIFITDLLTRGRNAVFLPITIAVHPKESSGGSWGTERDLRARAKVFTRVFGSSAPFVRAVFYLKNYGKTNGLSGLFQFVRGKYPQT
jgi:hypothetical protein